MLVASCQRNIYSDVDSKIDDNSKIVQKIKGHTTERNWPDIFMETVLVQPHTVTGKHASVLFQFS